MFAELMDWLVNLDPVFAFLLATPFVVALAGFLAEWMRSEKRSEKPRTEPRDVHVSHIGRASMSGS
jgi:hypothetical protein